MTKIIDYMIVGSDVNERDNLATRVINWSKQGWELYGFPYATLDDDGEYHYQAMIKYEE